ncbi:MAG TPA: biotin/lipoyl-containing protein [Fimbriimonadaceae bacterium]|nr:biotin/lipoyl-containing protein [Fimbriimonadaceae bacterium]
MADDLTLVRHALTVAREADFASVELEGPNIRFSAELARGARTRQSAAADAAEPAAEGITEIRSPLVGYFSPAPKPVKKGDSISNGDVIGIVTALGIPNEVLAESEGVVEQVLIASGAPVEFGQPLLKVKPE